MDKWYHMWLKVLTDSEEGLLNLYIKITWLLAIPKASYNDKI